MKRISCFVGVTRRHFITGLSGLLLWAGCSRPSAGPSGSEGETSTPDLAASKSNSSSKPVPSWNGEGDLREYYLHGKYTQEELDAVANGIKEVFGDREASQQRQMVAEILSFHHVIFHPTDYHDLRKNHAQIRKHRPLLEKMCERHGVPVLPVLAITSWENSGGSTKVSWADAAGLGQMTWGAVDEAHRYAARKAQKLKEQADWEKYHGKILKDKKKLAKSEELYAAASALNVEQRHRQMAQDAGVKDERAIAECNLEDVVLFFDFLLSQFGGRVDHAIGAYHKGVLNQDDILYDYMRRRDPTVLYPQPQDRTSFLEALERLNVTYLDLWNDPRSREMLNGLRTVEGERTTRANAHLALGDESDIYPWKVLGSLSALLAGEEYLDRVVERYSVPQLAGEVRGLPAFKGEDGRKEGANRGFLVEFSDKYWDGETKDKRQSWVRPELAGYLFHLRDRMGRLIGNGSWKIPIVALGKADDKSSGWEQELHAKGVAVRLGLSGLSIGERDELKKLLQQDYLFDRIYLRSSQDEHHLVLNPRFGHEFMKLYQNKIGVKRAGD
ncbi:MAG: hypothetical protein KC800_20130 [Candidatus Eremiobacteraeota bacterium]|nr:hypothetical protein [Candidatus Eremiobacteraeota bacterium]